MVITEIYTFQTSFYIIQKLKYNCEKLTLKLDFKNINYFFPLPLLLSLYFEI